MIVAIPREWFKPWMARLMMHRHFQRWFWWVFPLHTILNPDWRTWIFYRRPTALEEMQSMEE